ncbi:MFS transporter [Bacillus fonticola]|uniref:MFS transporter n=1 Tax=Bacillus fonticola TaxID=2728853 RepID=UPI001D155B0B|nr:MFS transporter [Bacillus fonticola]
MERTERSWKALYFSLPIFSWALFDFASTIFSSNITTIFFPFYLQETVGTSEQLNQISSTWISYANALGSLLLVLFSPLYGVSIDRTGRKKRPIFIFMVFTTLLTAGMGLFASWETGRELFALPVTLLLVILCFVFAKFTFQSSQVFYDSMISDLGEKKEIPLISGFGVAVGYMGTLVGLSVYLYVGDGDFSKAFIPTAILFFVFSLPILFWSKEKKKEVVEKKPFFSGYKEIATTIQDMRKYRSIFLFMIAYFFLNDAIATTIAMMAVYAKAIVGFTTSQFILLYLVSTVSSIIGAFVFGFIAKAKGPKVSVRIVAYLLIVALSIGTFAVEEWMFWIAGSLFGVALGSTWVTSRAYIVELTPEAKRGQFFGLFAFSGKVSSIVGPVLYGSITWALADYGNIASRTALGSLIVLTVLGLIFLERIREDESTMSD